MGQKYTKDTVDLVSSHPTFKTAKVITEKDQRHIATVVASDDEGYNAWKKLLTKHEKKLGKNEFLLLPKKHTFTKQGLCAHTGNVAVRCLITIDWLRLLPIHSLRINRKPTWKATKIQIIWPLVLVVRPRRCQKLIARFKSAGWRYQTWERFYQLWRPGESRKLVILSKRTFKLQKSHRPWTNSFGPWRCWQIGPWCYWQLRKR